MAKLKYDAAVKVGEYEDENGDMKGRYENVGKVFQGDNGPFLVLKRTFNPAGVPNPEDSDSIFISFFEPRERDGKPQRGGNGGGSRRPQGGNKSNSGGTRNRPSKPRDAHDDDGDDVAF